MLCVVYPNVSKGVKSHVNFWATTKESNIAHTTHVLFFDEFSNDADEKKKSLCFFVSCVSVDSGMFCISH